MIQDPDINAQKLCRVLSDDAALTARILSVSRSPYFAQRILPTNLISAVQVLGFQNLRNIVVANATHSLFVKGNLVSERLWDHSLAVALAMRILFQRAGIRNGDIAFLTGLLHDLGEVILLHGDPAGFAKLGEAVQRAQCQMADKEQEFYGFDHTLIGLTLLDSWNIDSQIGTLSKRKALFLSHLSADSPIGPAWAASSRFFLVRRVRQFSVQIIRF
jgi:HD-like signal output (HDOD) protein